MPTNEGQFKGIAVSRVPWHEKGRQMNLAEVRALKEEMFKEMHRWDAQEEQDRLGRALPTIAQTLDIPRSEVGAFLNRIASAVTI